MTMIFKPNPTVFHSKQSNKLIISRLQKASLFAFKPVF